MKKIRVINVALMVAAIWGGSYALFGDLPLWIKVAGALTAGALLIATAMINIATWVNVIDEL